MQPKTGPIRADLLGNMWAQEWGNIYPLVAPAGAGDLGYDIGELLEGEGQDPLEMVKYGEGFYSSLGFDAAARDVLGALACSSSRPTARWSATRARGTSTTRTICASRCASRSTADDFVTIHHELGHNYYQRAYNKQPYLYLRRRQRRVPRGDRRLRRAVDHARSTSSTSACSTSRKVPSADKDIGLLLRQAMDKVAFLPFGLLIDKWRWGVFDGKITPANYNERMGRPEARVPGHRPAGRAPGRRFDPGAKYHIPGNTPYTRYFLARILQFQFYKAACKQAGWKGPLHRCWFYGNKAGRRRSSTRCWRWARRSRGPTRSRPSPAAAR